MKPFEIALEDTYFPSHYCLLGWLSFCTLFIALICSQRISDSDFDTCWSLQDCGLHDHRVGGFTSLLLAQMLTNTTLELICSVARRLTEFLVAVLVALPAVYSEHRAFGSSFVPRLWVPEMITLDISVFRISWATQKVADFQNCKEGERDTEIFSFSFFMSHIREGAVPGSQLLWRYCLKLILDGIVTPLSQGFLQHCVSLCWSMVHWILQLL